MSFAKRVLSRIQKFFRRSEPQDPYAYVIAGLKRGPSGRSSAVALEEPQPRRFLNLFGRQLPR